MTTHALTKNYRDHSNDTGFQFEFFCDKCGNGHRSGFKHSAVGVAASMIKAAGAILGGAAHRAGWGAEHVKDALRGPAWDSAFKEAIEECRPRFRQCTVCGKWVCPDVCWNHARGLCEECAPDLGEHAPAIQAQVGIEQARQQAQDADQLRGADLASAPLAVAERKRCSECQAELSATAKFCASCGAKAAPAAAAPAKRFCSGCGVPTEPGSRFCSGCGTPVGA